MRIGVVGNGIVGSAVARTYLGFADVLVYDVMPERRTHSLGDVMGADLVMICVPEADVESVLKDAPLNCNAVIKSTVPIGTTRRLCEQIYLPNLCHSPEFLTERCAHVDALTPARNVIGYPRVVPQCGKHPLKSLYQRRFPGVQLLEMTSDESEAVKLFTNAFFATKIAYWNECRTLADKLGLSWDAVMAGVLSDGRIAHSHTSVPGQDGKRGFGGKCLVKDAEALAHAIEDAGQVPHVVRAALTRNVEDRRAE